MQTNAIVHQSTCEKCPSLAKGIFCDLHSNELLEVSRHKVVNLYKKGQNLFVQGNPAFGLFCVGQGTVKISCVGSNGKEIILRIAKGGDIIGQKYLYSEDFYSATATAIEDCEICFIDKKFIIKAIREKPTVAINIISKLGQDIGAAEEKISSFYQKNVRERLSELLLLLKESHGKKLDNGKWKINLKLTREEMAAMIGTASETLIRFMSELRDEGIISQQKKTIFILKEKELINFAGINEEC